MVLETIPKNRQDRNDIVERIHHEYSHWIHQTINNMVRLGEDADDIFQDFFVMLLTEPQLPCSIQNRGFLYRALHHDVIDFMRRKKTYRDRISRVVTKIPPTIHSKSTLDKILSQHECSFITKLIDEQLSGSIRKVLKLYINCDIDNLEIARRLNLGQASTRRYLYLGRKKIKSVLIKKGYRFNSAN